VTYELLMDKLSGRKRVFDDDDESSSHDSRSEEESQHLAL